MLPEAHVFIATSLDGFIADASGGVDWLVSLPAPEGEDHGYGAFMEGIDCLLMGAGSYRSLLTFPEWLYDKPVFVLSHALAEADIPDRLKGRVRLLDLPPAEALAALGAQGVRRVYLDGGKVISSFLREGLVQRLIVTRVPVLLGRGLPLFHDTGPLRLRHVETRSWAHGFVQSTYSL
ncbi:MAG: dihydrofolate reductase [Rhodobacteraceae bacterium]|nr:dihydrofolate reductase [Paracoccaceae bacterium]